MFAAGVFKGDGSDVRLAVVVLETLGVRGLATNLDVGSFLALFACIL